MSLNKVIIQGRLVADPELRHTTSGVAVANFRVAVDRDRKDKETGEIGCDFFNVTAWRQVGEFVCRWFRKGAPILVEGKLQSRSYTDNNGNQRSVVDVQAESVYFAGEAKRDGQNSQKKQAQFQELNDDADLPF